MVALTSAQRTKLQHHIADYVTFRGTVTGQQWIQERIQRKARFNDWLSQERISILSEVDAREMIRYLWATNFFRNKDYKADSVLKQNGIETIRAGLAELLYGSGPIDVRYDHVHIKGLGPSSITEIMHFTIPKLYCIWNDKPKTVLPYLGLDILLPKKVFEHQISGKEYVACCEVIGFIREELVHQGMVDADFTDADCFFWYMFSEVLGTLEPLIPPSPTPPQPPVLPLPPLVQIETHSDAQAALLRLGKLLGYDTYVADPSKESHGYKLSDLATLSKLPPFTYQHILDSFQYVDVVWFDGEFPIAGFEVEHTTGVTNGLLRLYQISQLEHVKFFIIAPDEVRGKFEIEVSKVPFNAIKERYQFRSYTDLEQFGQLAERYHKAFEQFLGW